MNIKKKLKQFLKPGKGEHESDYLLLVIMGVLLAFGLAMLSSASSVVAYNKFGNSYYYFNSQLLHIVLGLAVFYFFSRINYTFWKKYAVGFLFVSCLFLLLVFIPGVGAHYGKAHSWINVFGFSLQPSEFVKVFFLIYLAAWLERRGEELNYVSTGIAPFLLILAVISFLMIMQPDIGTLSIIAVSSFVVYFIGGGRYLHLITVGLLAAIALTGVLYAKPYVKERFSCVINPEMNVKEECYQVNQSLIAIGSGGFWGRGIGQSRQKYMFLPEVSGDSVFSILAEEIGFIFSILVIFLYLALFWRGVVIASRAPDRFGQLLAVGIVSWIMIQTFLNIGGMVNLIPMTGVPLPFISYGGSSIVAALLALGILVNISKYTD